MFNNIDEVYSWLFNQKKLAKRENLDRISKCIDMLGIKTDYKIIHIAGTNGKGSTASYIKSILQNTGKHIGFFVSPYVVCFNERIQINDRYISNAEIMHYCNKLYNFSNEYYKEFNDVIPFFELTFLMALLYFMDRNIDIAVIECGVGGLLDATNVLKTDLAIITNIGYDHMNTLGNSLEEIASHKLGIAKKGMTCLTACDEGIRGYFEGYQKDNNINMIYINDYVSDIVLNDYTEFKYKGESYKASLIASYQAFNASLAVEAAKIIDPNIPNELINYGLMNAKWPGRMETISNNPRVILDGAHNIHGINALVNSIKAINISKRVKVIFSALNDKAFDKMLSILDNISDKYYFTSIMDLRATDTNEFTKYTQKECEIIYDIEECLRTAINDTKEDELLLVTGSLHFISLMRDIYFNKIKEK